MLQATFLSNNCFEHLTRLIQNSKVGGAQRLGNPSWGLPVLGGTGLGWGGLWRAGWPKARDGSAPLRRRDVAEGQELPWPLVPPFSSPKARGRRRARWFR